MVEKLKQIQKKKKYDVAQYNIRRGGVPIYFFLIYIIRKLTDTK